MAPMAVESLVDRMAILVTIRRFFGMGQDADSHSLRFESYVGVQHFVRRSTYVPWRRSLGDVGR
jgi:hypothetical protein